jgi:Uma2 family endonuclease
MSNIATPELNHVLLYDISWRTFEGLLADLGNQRGRLAYDRGTVEIMSPSEKHEHLKGLIRRLIEPFADEMDIAIRASGSTTLKSELKRRGVEPDECYYVQNEAAVRGREDVDLETDPMPDLALEIEVTKSSLDRRSIYAALGIQELWVYDGKKLEVLRLGAGEAYEPSASSLAFPMLPIAELSRILQERHSMSDTALVRAFRAWVRERSQAS